MKRFVSIFSLLAVLGLLAACGPRVSVENNVVPWLTSATPIDGGSSLLLQGLYFADGQGGAADNSFILVGANINGDGGVRAEASEWSDRRIVVPIPEGAASGYVFVVVRGARSSGLPVNLPTQ